MDSGFTPAAVVPTAPAPSTFRVGHQYRWIVAEDDGIAGFAIYVRSSITHAEQEAIRAQHDDIIAFNVEWRSLTDDERAERAAAGTTPRQLELSLIAPHVHAWNAVGLDADGNEQPIPPPAVAGIDVFELVTADVEEFIVNTVLLGYRATGKAGGWKLPSIITSGPQIA